MPHKGYSQYCAKLTCVLGDLDGSLKTGQLFVYCCYVDMLHRNVECLIVCGGHPSAQKFSRVRVCAGDPVQATRDPGDPGRDAEDREDVRHR